jgi:putative lysine/arginine/ornithine/histidine/octopine transport system permease protein
MDVLLLYSGQLLQGLLVTLALTAVSIPPAFGIVVAGLQLAPARWAAAAARAYTAIFRGVPELLILFFFYYGLAGIVSLAVGYYVEFSNFEVAIVALASISGAYSAEVFRGAIDAVPRGQWESAAALGLHKLQSWALVILPQAARLALPSLGNLLLILLKDTALASAVGTEELLRKSAVAAGSTHAPFTFFGTASLIYLAITLPVLLVQERIEQAAPVRR